MTATTNNRAAAMEDVFSDGGQASSLNLLGHALPELADRHPDVVVLSADLGSSLTELRERHPNRHIEMGIAETNSISAATMMPVTLVARLSGLAMSYFGASHHAGVGAAKLLEGLGINAAVLDAAYIKPLDEDTILDAARTTGAILTV
ncbi:transketolase C-terminal domain-containing protein [Rhodococcus sp. IEGM 1379]|uniref:transketolase C-terminal domain-containing protein n=1 Tax=Rhodococcus sp. IEGM 1379 TaxID=3047086 RepID=UPI0024B739D1|nr:transketolase C-terminal domain-containing protein [Rhodococcus sp. IEGM 1379]MDI9914221.1 transketolase C-terminal domain-containing protein [Rhodococcus sp. IEGM 1379]